MAAASTASARTEEDGSRGEHVAEGGPETRGRNGSSGREASTPKANARPARLASETAPPGLTPVHADEQKDVESKCAPLGKWIEQNIGKAATRKAAGEKLVELLAKPPTLQGVDVPRCADIMVRGVREYLARSREGEAISTLKTIMLAMASAAADDGALCPSAAPVPKDVSALAREPYQSSAADWQSGGWRCLHIDLASGRQRYQYQVKTAQDGQSFEAIARGHSVDGAPLTELFIVGKLEGGKVEPNSDVYRR